MEELDYKKGRALLLEKDEHALDLHVGRGPTTFDLSLFVAVIIVWIFDVLFIGDPLHTVLLLLLVPLGYRGFKPLVKTDVEMRGHRYRVRRHLFGFGRRSGGEVRDLRVDFELEGLYDGGERLASVTPEIGRLIQVWIDRHGAETSHLRAV